MFELRNLRRAISEYKNILQNYPEIIRENPDVYLEDLDKLLELTSLYVGYQRENLEILNSLNDLTIFKFILLKKIRKKIILNSLKNINLASIYVSELDAIKLRISQIKIFKS